MTLGLADRRVGQIPTRGWIRHGLKRDATQRLNVATQRDDTMVRHDTKSSVLCEKACKRA